MLIYLKKFKPVTKILPSFAHKLYDNKRTGSTLLAEAL